MSESTRDVVRRLAEQVGATTDGHVFFPVGSFEPFCSALLLLAAEVCRELPGKVDDYGAHVSSASASAAASALEAKAGELE